MAARHGFSLNLLVVRVTAQLGRGMKMEEVEMSISYCCYWDLAFSPLNKLFSDCQHFDQFPDSEKVDLTSFDSVLTAFLEIFKGPYFAIFVNIPPFYGIYSFLDINYYFSNIDNLRPQIVYVVHFQQTRFLRQMLAQIKPTAKETRRLKQVSHRKIVHSYLRLLSLLSSFCLFVSAWTWLTWKCLGKVQLYVSVPWAQTSLELSEAEGEVVLSRPHCWPSLSY